jgi:hypothetical protein
VGKSLIEAQKQSPRIVKVNLNIGFHSVLLGFEVVNIKRDQERNIISPAHFSLQ